MYEQEVVQPEGILAEFPYLHSSDAAEEATRLHEEVIAARGRLWDVQTDLKEAEAHLAAAEMRWQAAEAIYTRMWQHEFSQAIHRLVVE